MKADDGWAYSKKPKPKDWDQGYGSEPMEPVILGGSHEMSNLVTACEGCNLSKGPKTLKEWRPDIWEAMHK